jgi:hypothetical protein
LVKASGLQAIQQGLFAKGFAQESDCPCGQHLADIGTQSRNVCFVPEADSCTAAMDGAVIARKLQIFASS